MTGPVPDPGTRPPQVPIPNLPGPGGAAVNAAGAAANAATAAATNVLPDLGIGENITAVRAWISDRHNWVRVMWFGGGVVLFAVGAAMIARPATQSAAQAAMTVIPAGKAATAAKAVAR